MDLNQKYIIAREQARKSCIRSACFLGLGLNSTNNDSSQASVLTEEIAKARLPDWVTPEHFDNVQEDYKSWVTSHGLKELMDSLSAYFDQIYECTILASKKSGLADADSAGKINQMREKDLPGKLRALRSDFGIESEHSKHLTTIYKAYDCMLRFHGKVSERYYNTGTAMKVSWCVLGKTKKINYLKREKQFKTGKHISFKAKELLELGIFACILCDSIFDSAVQIEFARGLEK